MAHWAAVEAIPDVNSIPPRTLYVKIDFTSSDASYNRTSFFFRVNRQIVSVLNMVASKSFSEITQHSDLPKYTTFALRQVIVGFVLTMVSEADRVLCVNVKVPLTGEDGLMVSYSKLKLSAASIELGSAKVSKEGCAFADCSICLGGFEQPYPYVILTFACGHTFDYCCIIYWLMDEPTCPLCRRSVRH